MELSVENISFKHKSQEEWIIRDFSRKFSEPSIILLQGDIGSGKTTFLQILNGIIPQHIKGVFSGNVILDGQNITRSDLRISARNINFLQQDCEHSFLFTTVEQEIVFPLENLGKTTVQIENTIETVLDSLSINELRFLNPCKLSYGQKKLVQLALLLAISPDVLLLDEPFLDLSDYNIHKLQDLLLEYKNLDKLIVMVDSTLAMENYADETLYMEDMK